MAIFNSYVKLPKGKDKKKIKSLESAFSLTV